jgi:hypothetical protein
MALRTDTVGQFPAFPGTEMQPTPHHRVLSNPTFVIVFIWVSRFRRRFVPSNATHAAHLIFLDVITLIFGEEYKT